MQPAESLESLQRHLNREWSSMKRILFSLLTVLSLLQMLSAQRTVPNSGVYWAPMTINNISAWYASDGRQEANSPELKLTGATFPRNTTSAVYSSGFLFGGVKRYLSARSFFVNGGFKTTTLKQGAILGTRTGVAENNKDPKIRIWRIRKDFFSADLRRDASETYGISEQSISIIDMQRLRAEYKKDWKEWPAAAGAPYYDKNNNGMYDPAFILNEFGVEVPDTSYDSPGLQNADQVIWYVCNDLSGKSPWGSVPLGLEMQITVWGYNTSGALANTIFRKCTVIYKGTSADTGSPVLEDMYLGIWSGIDLGGPLDNLAGSDPTSGLVYAYNSKILDLQYSKFNIVPPSLGYQILQGPIFFTGKAGDSAMTGFSYRKGFMNIPPSSLTYFGPANQEPNAAASNIFEMYNSLRGYESQTGQLRIDPTTQQPSKFWASGDPVTRTGWIDGISEGAQYRGLMASAGTFTMAIGDTQEMVTAFIAAESPDRLGSINVLKHYSKNVLNSFRQQLVPPPSLPMTNATVTELNKSFLLEWEKDTARLRQTEKFSDRGYQFEGYNLYQRTSPSAPFYQWKKIATYDLKNEVMQIVQDEIDPVSGRVIPQVKQEGKNSGIVRYVILKDDAIRNSALVNGQQYYFALTSYAYTPNQNELIRTIESEPQLLTVTPHIPNPETVISYTIKDSLENLASNIIGNNDGRIGVKILDPYSIIGGNYDFWFGVSGASSTWTMVRDLPGSDYATINVKLTPGDIALPRPIPSPTSAGTATFTLNDAMDRITFSVDINTTTDVTSIELARGPKTQNGTLLKTLAVNAKSAMGVWSSNDAVQPLTPSIIRDLAAGFIYVIVRSVKYPVGEIRGQLFDGVLPRVTLIAPDQSTSSRSVFSFTENRFPNEGISLYVSPAPLGFRSGEQRLPTRSNIVNEVNNEGTFSLVGPGISWAGYNQNESEIEFRFTNDTNWAIVNASIPSLTKFIRVPFQVYQDSVRVWAVIENAIPTDSLWDIRGNSFKNGKPTFDKIVGITNRIDAGGNDISYNTLTQNGVLPATNALRGRLINGVNHIAKNITFVNEADNGKAPAPGTAINLTPYKSIKYGDIKRVAIRPVIKKDKTAAHLQLNTINVFPNPYYGVNNFETSTSNKYVTFSHLPEQATIRIFSLAGLPVRKIEKNDPGQFIRWDLRNEKGFFVASGLYIIYIDMGEVGVKTVKLAVIMEDQNLNTY